MSCSDYKTLREGYLDNTGYSTKVKENFQSEFHGPYLYVPKWLSGSDISRNKAQENCKNNNYGKECAEKGNSFVPTNCSPSQYQNTLYPNSLGQCLKLIYCAPKETNTGQYYFPDTANCTIPLHFVLTNDKFTTDNKTYPVFNRPTTTPAPTTTPLKFKDIHGTVCNDTDKVSDFRNSSTPDKIFCCPENATKDQKTSDYYCYSTFTNNKYNKCKTTGYDYNTGKWAQGVFKTASNTNCCIEDKSDGFSCKSNTSWKL